MTRRSWPRFPDAAMMARRQQIRVCLLMRAARMRELQIGLIVATGFVMTGCGSDSAPPSPAPVPQPTVSETTSTPSLEPTAGADNPSEFAPIQLGGSTGTDNGTSATATATAESAPSQGVLDAMMPLQIMLGTWRGVTQNQVGDFNAIDQPSWIWDFQTDRNQPAMVMTSDGSPYLRSARLTYLTEDGEYQLSTIDPDGKERTLRGKFSAEPREEQGDDRKLHRTYKLELTEVDPEDPRDAWQVVFNQQDNNRYLVELSRKRGSRFARFDTIATQREGTSFALSDEDYGEKTCIISQGLGTIQVSYQGKSYWVCCTGCKAAFEEDPESWIAEFEAKQKKSEP